MTTSTATLGTSVPSANYQPVAVVDWIAFTVKLQDASHGGYLKRKYETIGVSHANPLDAGPGGAAHTFRIRLQHPQRYKVINDLLTDLESTYGFSEPPCLDALEVSIDFWPADNDPMSGFGLTKTLMMGITPPLLNNPRLVDEAPTVFMPTCSDIDACRTLYIGNSDEDLMWRVYWKRTDETFIGEEGKRHPKPLPPEQWRARVEVRIQGKALAHLSLATPGDLKDFSFQRLYTLGYFKFCRPITGTELIAVGPQALYAAKHLGIGLNSPACMLGKVGRRDARGRSLKLSRNLQTNTEISEACRSALRGLSRRF